MKRFLLTIALAAVALLATACTDNKVQPTLVPVGPGNTGTTAPSATPTATPSPTPTPILISPIPTQALADGSDFLEIMRLLSPGTQVDLEGASETDINRCFYVEELNAVETQVLLNNGLLETETANLQKLRILYYLVDGKAYIGEFYVHREKVWDVYNNFLNEFNNKTMFDDFDAESLSNYKGLRSFTVKGLNTSNREYIYLYK